MVNTYVELNLPGVPRGTRGTVERLSGTGRALVRTDDGSETFWCLSDQLRVVAEAELEEAEDLFECEAPM